GRRAPRPHESLEAAVERFRLLPPDTAADPTLLAHLARESFVRGDGGFTYRFDPACYGERKPVDAWPLLGRIQAPTLVVRGELSPILPPDMAERLRAAIPSASLVEIPGAWHHLVLDRPDAFAAAVTGFLG
ncbi:MAG: alpha/beta fold hydrolase, partial [Candidatus Rokuibacteriota bacterium]